MRRYGNLDDPLIRAYEQRIAASAAHHESLSILPPPKLNKFGKGQALPFGGYSLVQWIDPQHALWHKLTALCRFLQEAFVREQIEQCFYFLPAATFHVTVRDLVLGRPHNQDNYVQAIQSVFKRLSERRMKPAEMQAEGACFIGQSSIAVILHAFDGESLSTLVEVRRVIEDELKDRNEIFTELDAADFFGHVTLVYPVGELPAEIYGRAKQLVRAESQRAGPMGDLVFDAIELRRFDSMVDWSEPLETLRFGGAE